MYVSVSEYSVLTLAEQQKEYGGTFTTIAGHPAATLKGGDVVVAEGKTRSGDGIVKAYATDPDEQRIGTALLVKILPHFARN